MSDPPIKDIPSLKKIAQDARTLGLIARPVRLVETVRAWVGRGDASSKWWSPKLMNAQRQGMELIELPDRFNDLFGPHGWIMYDLMSVEAAQAAIALADARDMASAEASLVAYYNAETVALQITWMSGSQAFRPRSSLARKAAADYAAQRYHACVPVVLALLDGMIDDLGGVGFFAQNADLLAWDSIAGHPKGLATLVRILTRERKKTNTAPLDIPYRHGILHGHDLGYDNPLAAAKAWGALFAAGELVRKVERGERTAPPPKPQRTVGDVVRLFRETQEDKRQLAAWRPRNIQIGVELPATGGPHEYEEGSPERTLVEFLSGWQRGNFGQMARCLRDVVDQHQINKMAGDLRTAYQAMYLKTFQLLEVRDDAPAVTEIRARITYESAAGTMETERDFRPVNEDSQGLGAVRGKPGSRWVLYTPFV